MVIYMAIATLLSMEAWAGQEDDWLAPPGKLYSIGSHRLHIHCVGNGSPAVILDAGLGGISLEWTLVQKFISRETRICAYDRAGYGWSDPGPSPRATDQIVEELHDLLVAAEVPPPYVLVGHSFGGYNVQYFAKVYPELTAGMVLVDASHPEQAERLSDKPITESYSPTGRLITTLHPEHALKHYPENLRNQAMVLMASRKAIETQQREFVNYNYSGYVVLQSGRLRDIPLVVVTRGQREWPDNQNGRLLEQKWQSMQRDLVSLVPDAKQMIAARSGHLIHLEQPEIVVAAIQSVLESLATGDSTSAMPISPPQ